MNFVARRFPARMSALTEVLACVGEICNQAEIKHNAQLRMELVVEELFTNTVLHGYGGDCDLSVWIAANFDNEKLCITYQDEAPAYNPLDRSNNITTPSLGGLGVALVERFAHTRYLHENGRNTLILTFQPSPD